MKLQEAVAAVAAYGPRELPTTGRRRTPVVVRQEVIVGWWHDGGVNNRRAFIDGMEDESVVFVRNDTGKRWACPARDLIYVRRWPEE